MATSMTQGKPLDCSAAKDLHSCPMDCGHAESHGHYLLCTSPPACTAHNLSITTIRRQMVELQKCPGIITWIVQALEGKDDAIPTDGDITYFGDIGADLLHSQGLIGWDSFRRGFISSHWLWLQAFHARVELSCQHFDTHSWSVSLIKLLWQHGQALWEAWNEALHGSTPELNRGKRLALLCRRVQQLYNHEDRKYIPGTLQKDYFGMPVLQCCRQGLYSLTAWIKFVERRLHMHQEEAMKRTIHAWLEKDTENGERKCLHSLT